MCRSTGSERGVVYDHYVPAGTVIVNCTDSLLCTDVQNDSWEPIVQNEDLVLAPQGCLGFTGPSAHILTHAWYSNTLGSAWRHLLRGHATTETKEKRGMQLMLRMTVNAWILRNKVPWKVLAGDRSQPLNIYPLHRRLLMGYRMHATLKNIYPRAKLYMPERWDDDEKDGITLDSRSPAESIHKNDTIRFSGASSTPTHNMCT